MFPGYSSEPDDVLNPKKKVWEMLQPDLHTNTELVACYKDVPFTTTAGVCNVSSISSGSIRRCNLLIETYLHLLIIEGSLEMELVLLLHFMMQVLLQKAPLLAYQRHFAPNLVACPIPNIEFMSLITKDAREAEIQVIDFNKCSSDSLS
ncbi:hypothetical protein AAC387_Pa06g1764 [Persea americana]